MKLIYLLSTLLLSVGLTNAKKSVREIYPYKNPKFSIEQRVDDLLKRMTVEEKVYQMCALRLGEGDEIFRTSGEYTIDLIRKEFGEHGIGNVSCPTTDRVAEHSAKIINEIQRVAVEETRLGIPVLVNDEALHGIKGKGATSYPQSIALSSTWNLPLMREVADAIGREAHSRGITQVLSPTLDLARDPRHGRMEETYGEDPGLVALFGVEFIKGVQGQGVVCSPKHFIANFVASGGREAGNIALSERELREIHLVPYEAAVKQAGVKSLMAAYNAIDGVPCHANRWLLTDVLRDDWGFTGFTVSDWSGVNHTHGYHRIASSWEESAVLCSKAGLDVDLPRIRSYKQLTEAIKSGKIKESDIDVNVRRILRVKFELGLFENPYVEEKDAVRLQDAPELRRLARKAARQSIVLLKNENQVLPLNYKKIAVVGPNADVLQLGGYSAVGVKGNTPLQGIRAAFEGASEILYAKGCGLTQNDCSGFDEALSIAGQADVTVLVMGGRNGVTGGETQDRIDLDLMGVQEELIKRVSALGKPVVVVLVDGRPVTMMDWIDEVDGVVMMFYAGEEGGNALGEVLSGKVNPSGKLTVTIPRYTGQLPMPLLSRPHGRESSFAEFPSIKRSDPVIAKHNRYYPLYPFGYGLSYTSFRYSGLKLSKKEIQKGDEIVVSVDITNEGYMEGDEIVQLYLTDLYCRISQPQKKLQGFQRVFIPVGETRRVTFTLTGKNMSFLNERFEEEIGDGEFEVFVGKNSMDGTVEKFIVK
ncbi:glycoside hydrolase family 3 N-terminal domain-containing protein [Parabacteroides sp.]